MNENKFVYRLIEPTTWKKVKNLAALPYTEIDDRDGFLHLSTFEQMLATAERYYAHVEELFALEIPLHLVADCVRFEKATNGEVFPHLYGVLSIANIKNTLQLTKTANGTFVVGAEGK